MSCYHNNVIFLLKVTYRHNFILVHAYCKDASFIHCSNSPLVWDVPDVFFLGEKVSSRTPVPGVASNRFSMCRSYKRGTYISNSQECKKVSKNKVTEEKPFLCVLTAALDWAKLFHAFVSSEKQNNRIYTHRRNISNPVSI